MRSSFKIGLTSILILAFVIAGTLESVKASDWWENIKVKGDLRYRHEMIDAENKDARNRQRIRARVGIYAKANEMMDIGIQLATGSTDPVSTNQTLDGAFSTKDIRLDLAYFTFHHENAEGFKITAGKMKNPFFKAGKSELIWDSDWNPEGGALTFAKSFDNVDMTFTGAGLWIDERSASDDSYIVSGQGVVRFNFNGNNSSFALGGSIYNYVNAKGYAPFYDDEDAKGNSFNEPVEDEGIFYANDFELVEFFGEVTHKVNNIPVTVMGDYVSNSAADSLNTGWLFGFRVGKAKKAGSWDLRYNYRNVEADAVVGIFTDSDFRGGGTDAKGHEIGASYQLAKNANLGATYFINEIGLEMDETMEFNRLQLDLQLKF